MCDVADPSLPTWDTPEINIGPSQRGSPSALGAAGAWIGTALRSPPSAGKVGRTELLWRWDQLPANKRQMLLLLAREMAEGERAA